MNDVSKIHLATRDESHETGERSWAIPIEFDALRQRIVSVCEDWDRDEHGPLLTTVGETLFELNVSELVKTVNEVRELVSEDGSHLVIRPEQIRAACRENPFFTKVKNSSQDGHHAMRSFIDYGGEIPSFSWPRKDVVPGLFVVMGDTGSGKTTHVVGSLRPHVMIRYSEPLESVDYNVGYDGYVFSASDLGETVGTALLLALFGTKVAIDGLRPLIYSGGGGAAKGGMSANLFDSLTSINNVFAVLATNVVATMNPMLPDPDEAHRLQVRVAASVAGSTHMVGDEAVSTTWRKPHGRVFEGRGRSEHPSLGSPSSADSRPGVETFNLGSHDGTESLDRNIAIRDPAPGDGQDGDDFSLEGRHLPNFDL
nr:MAG: hypothetical protein 2 [Jiangsu sediment cysto-like virus 9]